jgi:hypothetical protein
MSVQALSHVTMGKCGKAKNVSADLTRLVGPQPRQERLVSEHDATKNQPLTALFAAA